MFFWAQNDENDYDVDDDDGKNNNINEKILRKNKNNKQRPIGIAWIARTSTTENYITFMCKR